MASAGLAPLALLCAAAAATSAAWINMMVGPFRVIPGVIEDCPPELQPKRQNYILNYTARRDRKDQDVMYFSANLTTFRTLDDSYSTSTNLATWSARGGWTEGVQLFTFHQMCTSLKRAFTYQWRVGMKLVFNDSERNCPFHPGFYSVQNVASNMDITVPPAFYYGRYRGTGWVWHTKTKEILACGRCTFTLAPKIKRVKNLTNVQMDL